MKLEIECITRRTAVHKHIATTPRRICMHNGPALINGLSSIRFDDAELNCVHACMYGFVCLCVEYIFCFVLVV